MVFQKFKKKNSLDRRAYTYHSSNKKKSLSLSLYIYIYIYVCVCVCISISDRIKAKLQVTPNFTALVSGHGKTRAYLHRFKVMESPICPCGKEEQTTDHLMYRCILLQKPRETLKRETSKQGSWPKNKQELISKHLKQFTKFTNSIDFEIL